MRNFDPDDPMLTAYALGELEGEELREIEALVARDPAAARHVETIRAAAAGFGEAFEREPAPAVAPIRAVEIEPRQRSAFIPWLFYASTAAAACFFVVLVVRLVDPATLDKDSNLAAEAVLQPPAAHAPAESAALGAGTRAAAVEEAASDEAKRQVSDLRKEKAAAEGATAAVAEPSTALADKAESTFGSLAARDDGFAAKPAAAAPPPAKLGETKDSARLRRSRENEGEMRSFDSYARSAGDRASSSALAILQAAVAAGRIPESIDAAALLVDLGARELQEYREGDSANLAQTTLDHSPMPDPEAALVRAVEGFARLVAARTSATDEAWDRVLADGRYAAGSDEKRLAFVALVEQARELTRATREQ